MKEGIVHITIHFSISKEFTFFLLIINISLLAMTIFTSKLKLCNYRVLIIY